MAYQPTIRVDYSKLLKLIRKNRMSVSSFGKKAGMSRADLYMMQINEMMSVEGEFRACAFFKCDTSDIRDVYPTDPDDKDFK